MLPKIMSVNSDPFDLLIHRDTNLTNLWNQLHYKQPLNVIVARAIKSKSPPRLRIEQLVARLRRSSCAVVGASSALNGCPNRHQICRHDITIHANDHPALLKLCARVDLQFVNAHACFHMARRGLVTQPAGKRLRPCMVHPKIMRIRHEWSSLDLGRYTTGAVLSSGLGTRYAHRAVGKCCASAGGVAAAYALQTCKTVTVFGMGGFQRAHMDNSKDHMVSAHNMLGERDWLMALNSTGALAMHCS